MERKIKFGVFADLHVDIMHDTQERLEVFLEDCRKENVDFIIQLGDFCYPDKNRKCVCKPENRPANIKLALSVPTYADKDTIIGLFNNFEKPSYHVLGNHECDMCSKQETLNYYNMDHESYYSFDMGGFHFVVLDCNYFKDGDKYIAYENGNYFDTPDYGDRVLPYLPPEELEWLKEDLAKAQYPSVFFSHQCLCDDNYWAILNNKEVIEVLKAAPNGVLATFCGHEHQDYEVMQDNIWHVNINSMSCFWMDEDFVVENVYGEEIDKKYPNIKYTAPYKYSNYAIVTLTDEGIDIKGTKNEYVGPSAEERGLYEDWSWWKQIECDFRPPHSPEIKDRFLPFKK